jgi:hypothetical protein
VLRQLEGIRAEGVGFEQLGAGAQVFLVDVLDELGAGEVQILKRLVDIHALGVNVSRHGAVGEDDATGEFLEKGGLGGEKGVFCHGGRSRVADIRIS